MRTTVAIGIAGAAGALTRYGMESRIGRRGAFPWGTLTVNLSGALLLGLLGTVAARRLGMPMWLQSAAVVGFLGAYTTFSALSLETFRLFQQHRYVLTGAYALTSLLGGVTAIALGIRLGRVIS